MRATLFLPLLALALISTADAQSEEQSPLKCKECWSNSRAEIPECKNLSADDFEKLAHLDDATIAAIQAGDPLYPCKECLCALPPRTPDILQSCEESCPPEMADALTKEASIVSGGVCLPKSSLKTEDKETDSSTSGEGGAKDEPGTGDGSSSANSDSSSDDKPSAGGASSVQWSGALLTVVAVMASAVAF